MFLGSFLAETTSQTVATKFEDEIIRLEQRTWFWLSRERDEDHRFCNEALSEQLKEDKPQLISMNVHSNSATVYHWIRAFIGKGGALCNEGA